MLTNKIRLNILNIKKGELTMKKLLATALAAALVITSLAAPAFAYEDSSLGKNLIGAIGNPKVTVTKGVEFELEVRTGRNIDDSDLLWYTSNKNVVKVIDDDRTDDEIELKALALGTARIICKNRITGGTITYTVTVKNPTGTISAIGSASRTVTVGDEFELEVRKNGGINDSDLTWYTSNKSVVKVDDDDRSDDEIELKAVSPGTARITCKNKVTGGKIIYTVTVNKASKTISRIGAAARTVRVGDEFELEVKKNGGIKDSDLYWYTSNANIVKVDDDDRSDEEIELKAVGTGTAKITCKNKITGGKIIYTVTVKKATGTISRVGSSTVYVELGDEEDIEVRKSGLTNSQIKWYITDATILGFEDGDNTGSEVEVYGKKLGTTKVYAKNLTTGGKIYYTVKVVRDYDD